MVVSNPGEIIKLAGKLAATASMKLDYARFADKSRKILLVEGSTDEFFVSHVKEDDVETMVADNVFNSEAGFRTSPCEYVNCKEAITQLIFGISHLPSGFLQLPDSMDKLDIYGLVDRDNDELDTGRPTPRLFVTDTHDLETLMMSTDDELFGKIDGCSITEADVRRAYFAALQLSVCRELLAEYYDDESFDLSVIACGSFRVNFSAFMQNDKINICDLIKYIAAKSASPLPTKKIKQLTEKLLNDKSVKRRFDADGFWKQDSDNFAPDNIDGFWTSVNGHDILQLIQYYNEDAYMRFGSHGYSGINRRFENVLLAVYDYSDFSKTSVCEKMKVANIAR
ncbi:MAG: DUF4435 domain-containing protein [Clostridia bacterium]|nr:DUF4435 domain-containing protein [Clostridia bacterium]